MGKLYKVNAIPTVNFRNAPDGEILYRINNGVQLHGVYYNSTWTKACYNNKLGYITTSYLDVVDSRDQYYDVETFERYGVTNWSQSSTYRGDPVKHIQMDLNESPNYDCGPVDGIYGSKTKEAVTQFQKDYGLGADGIAGPATKRKLYDFYLNLG